MKSEIITAASEIAREKRISKEDLRDILEDIFSQIMKRKYGEDAEFDVIVNVDRGDMEIYVEKEVVREIEDPDTQISLKDARKIDPDIEEGELFAEVVNPENFGRRLINIAKQSLLQRLKEHEKQKICDEYSSRVGEIIIGDVHQETRSGFFINVDRTELFMPRSESIPGEKLRRGDSVRALIKEVVKPETPTEEEDDYNDRPRRRRFGNRPEIIVSRADERFLLRLFEIEVPEIFDGIVEIKAVARKAGERSKIAVESVDKRIDPVGACVGMRGVRIQSVVRELNNEKIDVIPFSNEPEVFVSRALTPAKPLRVIINEEDNLAVAIIADKEMGLALGRGESNKELAQKITGFNIELIKESESYEKAEEDEGMAVSEIPGLSPKIVEKLTGFGIKNMEELKGLGLQGLLEIPGIGQKTAQKILSQVNV
ncbi:MAG: transcription termination factor NusA [Calditrichia bacterium]